MTERPKTRSIMLDRPLDLRLTLAPTRIGRGDPTTRLRSDQAMRASRPPTGPVTLVLTVEGTTLEARAWGDGAEWALTQLPVLVGESDEVDFSTDHRLVSDLHARMPGLRVGATHRVIEALLPAVCGQRVSGYEAKRAYRQFMDQFGEPAPGPPELGLRLPPDPKALASASHQELHLIGLERARADIIRRAAARATSIEAVVDAPPAEAEQRIRSLGGVDLWTLAIVRAAALGDPDAVPVGDQKMKNLVAWIFAGERRGSDAQMLDLLEPFRGQRGRVLRLLQASGLGPPSQ